MDIAILNTGKAVELLKDSVEPEFASRKKWSLVGCPVGARPRKQEIWWVRTTSIAKRYTVAKND